MIEGQRVTPNWIILQSLAKEEYTYLNNIIATIDEVVNNIFNSGEKYKDSGSLFETCIIFARFYEFESKLSRFRSIVKKRLDELNSYYIDKTIKWDESRLEHLEKTIKEWKQKSPKFLADCSSKFTLNMWDERNNYPDFLGDSFNYICEDAIDSIINNNLEQFIIDYENVSKLMLIYQEYIRSDFIDKKDKYRVEYAYYIFTSPIVEWAQIGGLAILWGEFMLDDQWQEAVCNAGLSVLHNLDKERETELAEKLVELVQNRDSIMLGIGSRDLIETGWSQRVSSSIREHSNIQFDRFDYRNKTQSKLINAFCDSFEDLGFTTNPAEVFWVLCINPLLPEDKKYRSKFGWDRKLND